MMSLHTKLTNPGSSPSLKKYNKAVELHHLAQQGNGDAKHELKQIITQYESEAGKGNGKAQYYLGQCYYNGIGVKEDVKRALTLYVSATLKNEVGAKYCLAQHYENGPSVKRHAKYIYSLYLSGANQKHSDSQHHLAQCFDFGFGTKPDSQEALRYYKLASENEVRNATLRLAEAQATGELGYSPNRPEAVKLFRHAMTQAEDKNDDYELPAKIIFECRSGSYTDRDSYYLIIEWVIKGNNPPTPGMIEEFNSIFTKKINASLYEEIIKKDPRELMDYGLIAKENIPNVHTSLTCYMSWLHEQLGKETLSSPLEIEKIGQQLCRTKEWLSLLAAIEEDKSAKGINYPCAGSSIQRTEETPPSLPSKITPQTEIDLLQLQQMATSSSASSTESLSCSQPSSSSTSFGDFIVNPQQDKITSPSRPHPLTNNPYSFTPNIGTGKGKRKRTSTQTGEFTQEFTGGSHGNIALTDKNSKSSMAR